MRFFPFSVLKRLSFGLWCLACIFSGFAWADIRLPKLVSDGMVLQREVPVTVWGWADPEESVNIQFLEQRFQTEADAEGQWRVTLPPLEAGGPYPMTISGHNTLQLENVWVGEVWLASGQSNMELPMRRLAPLYRDQVVNAKDPALRFFTVPQGYDFDRPRSDFDAGRWQGATPETVQDFSGVAYFFARQIRRGHNVPVGVIHASVGGSPAQAWLSEAALKEFPHYQQQAKKFNDPGFVEDTERADRERSDAWHSELSRQDRGMKGDDYPWAAPGVAHQDWQTINIPGDWSSLDKPFNGVSWLRKEIDVPAHLVDQPALLVLGKIIDSDKTFINGHLVGETGYRYPPRRYPVPAGLLKEGKNTIAIRVVSRQGEGRLVADKTYQLQWQDKALDLTGPWHYRIGATVEPLEPQTFVRWQPGGLYNAMIAPLLNYRIQGAIWYQGESNDSAADEYRQLFPALIADWRQAWAQGNFPFLFVQLANYQPTSAEPADDVWARLREAQLKTLTSVPNTAMVVAMDVGEWNDIHPLNKKVIGDRLSLAARKLAYGETLVHSGPIYHDLRIEDQRAIVRFKYTGSGLVTSDNQPPAHISIAGEDRRFFWAKAEIQGDQLVVWSEQVPNPVAVRYAWANNPEGANLYNREGLPASPFRTDDWE